MTLTSRIKGLTLGEICKLLVILELKQDEVYCHAIIDSVSKENNDSESVVYILITVRDSLQITILYGRISKSMTVSEVFR